MDSFQWVFAALEETLDYNNYSSSFSSSSNSGPSNVGLPVYDANNQQRPDDGYTGLWNKFFGQLPYSGQTYSRTPVVVVCSTCSRFEPNDHVRLSDGGNCDRIICRDCFRRAVLDRSRLQSLVEDVLTFFEEKLNMPITQHVAVFLVDAAEIIKQTKETCFGLTMTNRESCVIVEDTWERDGRVFTNTKTQPLNHSSKITIEVLYGMPRLMMGGVLAHEFMHAWLKLKGVTGLEVEVEEGICQVIGYRWLKWLKASYPDASQYTKDMIRYLKHRVRTHESHAYGDGFRNAQSAVSRRGLKDVVDSIVNHGTLYD